MAVEIRAAAAADVAAILEFWKRSTESSHTNDVPSVSRVIEDDHASLLVAVDGGAIVGTVIAGWDGWRGSIYRLAVDASRRREGIAALLVDHAERWLRDVHGARRIGANVLEDNEAAVKFWASMRYEDKERVHRWTKG